MQKANRISWVKPFVFIGLIALVVACNSPSLPYEQVKPAEITLGSPLPTPTHDPILTVSGQLTRPNKNDTVILDMATFEKLGLVKYTVNDPWENRRVTYTGVLLTDLLKAIGISETATSIHLTALDDYQVDLTMAQIEKMPILLATQSDGQYMDLDHSGPTRLIFPFDTFSDAELLNYRNLAIWSISSIEVK